MSTYLISERSLKVWVFVVVHSDPDDAIPFFCSHIQRASHTLGQGLCAESRRISRWVRALLPNEYHLTPVTRKTRSWAPDSPYASRESHLPPTKGQTAHLQLSCTQSNFCELCRNDTWCYCGKRQSWIVVRKRWRGCRHDWRYSVRRIDLRHHRIKPLFAAFSGISTTSNSYNANDDRCLCRQWRWYRSSDDVRWAMCLCWLDVTYSCTTDAITYNACMHGWRR